MTARHTVTRRRLCSALVALALGVGGALLVGSGGASAATTPTTTTQPKGITVGPTLPGTTTGGTGSGAAPTTGSSGGCGLLDVSCHVTSAINDWFRGVVTSALDPVLDLLGRTVLATPAITTGRIAELWGIAAGIANSLVVLLVLAGGAIVMGHETVQTRTSAKDLAPRVVVGVIAANASLSLVGLAIGVVNALSSALLGQGVDAASATTVLEQLVVGSLATDGIFLVLMGLVAAVLAIVLVGTYVIRVALLILLVVAAPLALICHTLPQTEGTARLWWRAVAGLFAIQLAQSLVLITALRVFFASGGSATLGLASSGGLVDMLVACCLLWVLVRIPSYVARVVFAGSGHRGSTLARGAKTVVLYRLVRAGIGALG